MDIRFAMEKDIAGILALLRQVGQVHRLGRPDLFRDKACKYGASQILTMLNDPQNPIFVAASEDKVLGYAFCQMKSHPEDPVLTDVRSLYIDDLCVEETCRGQKIGQALYETVCRYAKSRKCYNVTLNVWSCNSGAMKFYEKMGLKPQKVGMEFILE